MKRGWLLGLLLLIAGCGRLGFGDEDDGGETGGALKILYPAPAAYHALLGETLLDIRPEFEGVTKFTIDPPLPAGLALNETYGKIQGTPSEPADRVKYTVTGTGPGGELSVEIYLTALPGWKVDDLRDFPDADGGVDAICASTATNPAGKCSLRAAVECANKHTTKRLILLPGDLIAVNATLTPLLNSMVIVGAGVGETTLSPVPVGQSQGLLKFEGAHQIRLENLAVQSFTPADGSTVMAKNGTFEAFEVEFRDNTSMTAGGVAGLDNSRARFENVTFLKNKAVAVPGWGGVIEGNGTETQIEVRSSTAMSNEAIWGSFAYVQGGASLELVNSSVVGNKALTAGALSSPDGRFRIINSTIAFNTNQDAPAAGLYINEPEATFEVGNSIIAHNKNGSNVEANCGRREVLAALTSLGGNVLSDDAGSCGTFFTKAGDVTSRDPLLESILPVADGGRTKTMPIQAESPAQGRGLGALCPSHDQRGAKRKLSDTNTCDSGAYERE